MKQMILAAMLAVFGSIVWAQTCFANQISDGFLSPHGSPFTGPALIARLYPDDEVTFLEERHNWFMVLLSDANVGWETK